ncbi:uncharacterized protein SPPG_06258 [Spizellomyces punctatus DAOM BR117]|uniref:Dynein heavy chain, cytoplasmic n=1 Tax=Spizellomyces punctatus (strain DAOM BR117) TaxID=645134 RepID=A0A0L0HCY4_SPIPD|nr:uncharacterized protein SPPG_06258 [Spizellomyces punctatus DAOM BR117]KNC98573.1 hypothetical protein SPPG_06258 [Spizellomyces punctatus DAOM BR117]|eukprot:XP_016606613.1 hypothetical protein SPPG_06258 [Spizellomyces punctatus DAOM BR117]
MDEVKEESVASASDGLVSGTVEPTALLHHVERLLPLVLEWDPSDRDGLLNSAEAIEKAGRFCTDPQVQVLYIVKEQAEPPEKQEGDTPHQTFRITVRLDLVYSPRQVASLAVIKRFSTVEIARPLQQQLQLINLPGPGEGGNPYEALHSYIHNAVSPFFDAFAAAKGVSASSIDRHGREDKDNKTGIPMAKKKIAELELSLLQLQQNVEIPDVILNFNPVVQRAAEICHEQGRRVNVDVVGDVINDSAVLNKLQADVNGWIKEIQKVTKLSRDPASGNASQEINFWLNMERALGSIEEQLKSDQVQLTLDILKHAKRFHATVSFYADTGMKDAVEKVQKYNILMKDFPLNELLSATDIRKIQESLILIFNHLTKKLKLSPYPIRRALPLVEAISRDLNEQLLRVLGTRRMMYMAYDDFEKASGGCEDVFRTWDDQVKEFTNVARDVTRKRSEKFLPIKINPVHAKLQERITFLRTFRRQHEQLHDTILKVMRTEKTGTTGINGMETKGVSLSDVNALDDIKVAYESVKNVDVLDVTPEGTEIWNQIIARLRDRLGTAKNANEMFRVFSKFNALFVRPKIRGAIQEYQAHLIESVKDDIKKLHDKFKVHYRNSQAYKMSQLRDLPPISGAIIWARQIERQLGLYMKRVEDVLGKGWEMYAEGQKLQTESSSFRKKLDTRPIYDTWLADIMKRELSVTGRIFEISRNRAQGNILQLGINFESQTITLFKEVRNLLWLNFQVPHTVANIAKDAKRVYPFAVSLSETVRTYTQTAYNVDRHDGISTLVAGYRRDVHSHISRGIQLRWDYFNRHVVFVRDFASVVTIFQDKVNSAIVVSDEIHQTIGQLKTCRFERNAFQDRLTKIQKLIDRLNLEGYSNLASWTAKLNVDIETVLAARLQTAIKSWMDEFMQGDEEPANIDHRRRRGHKASTPSARNSIVGAPNEGDTERRPNLEIMVHEIALKNQVMYVDPPIEEARNNWYRQLHFWLGHLCTLKPIQSSSYEMSVGAHRKEENMTYAILLNRLSDSLERCYDIVEQRIKSVQEYTEIWLRYQSLWDLESHYVYDQLGDDLRLWQQLVLEIKKARATFDNSETERSFGPIVIDYEQVQSKVNAKYDQWQREILNRFGVKLGSSMRDFYSTVSKSRTDLEQQSADGSSTAEAVAFITFVQDLGRKIPLWTEQVQTFKSSQKVLERQRYQFPNDWLYVDNVEGEWSAFNEILARKKKAIQEQIAGLQVKIVAEDKMVEQKIRDIAADWDKSKPLQGDIMPDEAVASLNIFEGRLLRLQDDYNQVSRAKEALDLDRRADNKLQPILEELRDLKGVWVALSGLWTGINEIRDTVWASAVPRKIRQQLDQLLMSMKEMSSRMRQYAAFDYAQETLKGYLKVNPLVTELKSEALKDRHWRQLFKALDLGAKVSQSELTIGHLWDVDLKKNEAVIREVITVAQGEMALEEFLKQVKETWTSFALDLVVYQNKCRLIKGWEELFTKCSENLNSLFAMKHSPFFKVFEEEASTWEDKLNRIHMLFDVWIDVQRQWVYLEGIFSVSVDIKHLLPVESSRFQSVNAEFMSLMKKVYKSPFVVDILNIPGIQKSMERLADLLSKIQRALGEYLERERSSFPRFYFVGDEDLLELIGNSKDIIRIQKHLKKMFAGIASLLLSEDSSMIEGLVSREGETVMLKHPISVKEHPRINDWLTLLEKEMRMSLAMWLSDAVIDMASFHVASKLDAAKFLSWMDKYPDQLVVLSMQILWTDSVEKSLETAKEGKSKGTHPLNDALSLVENGLNVLADLVLTDLAPIRRRKCEHLITELVHQRDVIRQLLRSQTTSPDEFEWLQQMRFYFKQGVENPLERLSVKMANATFNYGYEYLGVTDRLVQTPLTDRCYLTLTQALNSRLGGSPFGPAGTGKTESVKALGVQLGRFVLVFCCDENFDFQAMGRIFIGLCRVGAWGCFDEFNRLEERILSAVSQQVQSIQLGLKNGQEIELVNKHFKVDPSTGIFITMNPGYAGRSNLPDNLKKLFRSVAMTKPDRELIAQVMLYSQGFRSAELLASKVVPLFVLCDEQLSPQNHYDFGLRSLKSVLVSAGNLKREVLQQLRGETKPEAADKDVKEGISDEVSEQKLLIRSVRETVIPKLVADDIALLQSLLDDVFPGVQYIPVDLEILKRAIKVACDKRRLVADGLWLEKVVQLYQIQSIHHGLMMVGPSGSGKTAAHQVLLDALSRIEGIEGVSYVIDPKAMSKEALYGHMDPTTREWTDGLFTHILRKIVENVRGEGSKRHWIIFDGDVDPEWVENLNSVLDDNKLLTLPNGERLNLPPNVRIMFEVEDLKQATLATVSRCGMVWFSKETVSLDVAINNYLETLRHVVLNDADEDTSSILTDERSSDRSPMLETQRIIADILAPHMKNGGLVIRAMDFVEKVEHIMDFTKIRAFTALCTLLNNVVRKVLDYNASHPDFPMSVSLIDTFVTKRLLLAVVWSFTGDSKLETRAKLGDYLRSISTLEFPAGGVSLIDFDVSITTGEWVEWQSKVPTIEIETHNVAAADVVIPTMDTVRHEEVLYSWLSEHKPLILCGPPGSGKTMTLFSSLRKLPEMEVVGLNFSSATTPELILQTFEQYCEYRKTPNGIILSPQAIGRWLVLFCDEINLPAMDKYGTQRVISFIRQLVEHGGFWRKSDKAWVRLERIQFVGACNPPTDPGRVPLSHRFLRHAPVMMVDYPGEASLMQIYGTFSRAMLKVVPSLRGYAEPLTAAMVEFYLASQEEFTPDKQLHYIYSPRELTRWVRGIFEAMKPLESLPVEGLVRIWAHEALRLFQDRLVSQKERQWTDEMIETVALKHFPGINREAALARPILFSNWLSKYYVPVQHGELRDFVKARLKVFYEEELDVPLVLFNDVLEHVLRIDRVYRQMQGHLLLIGISGAGKTTLSRFVAWMNGLSVFQIKVHNKYSAADFDEDLRTVLRRAGCKGEKICFIMDESNVLDSGFLEKMNTLLANAEVPGLFEGDEHASLMTACKEGAQREGLMLDSTEELYKWFTHQIMKNLHVVFTMNPPQDGLASRAATSPALFNRCVLDWFGDWSDQAFFQVGREFTQALDLEMPGYIAPIEFPVVYEDLPMPPTYRDVIVNALVFIHKSLHEINEKLNKRQGRLNHVTPRHYLDFINHYVKLFHEKREDLEERQRHLNVGLDKLRETVVKVEELRKSLAIKRSELEAKNHEANEKLKKMVADQQEAEQKKQASLEIQQAIAAQNQEIEERRKVVLQDLAEAEPAVLQAQNSVSSIKKQHLQEVRTMSNPPEAVKMAMESVCMLLGHKADSWKTVQSIIRKDDFIPSIVNYDTDKMSAKVREDVVSSYLANPKYNFETVNRASQACGPLVQWVIAQVKYASILERVGPLRQEVQQLEASAEVTKTRAASIETMIRDLEESIGRYKEEYAVLISETQSLKTEMETVQTRVERSLRLLDNLASEKERWESGSRSFEAQMATIVGDVLLSAAFMAYGGYFSQQYRETLLQRWSAHLRSAGIKSKRELSIPNYLSIADERIAWQANSLPADNLCTENAIMLKRYNRYPLLIDPSGQATAFLLNEYKDRKITVTSFLDDSFLKVLESALRFGNPLLVQDVEHLDPILNPVLNRELRRTGGRVLIRLGGQDIDFSPSFTLFLSTRDPSVNFPPDLCSRVTFVNFTVTRESLQSQCLHEVLKAERPDTDRKRTDLLKLQGEFQLRLRHLEHSLLQALNASKGNILDDDTVISTLETLKQEAAEVTRKVEETDIIMQEVENVTAVYTPLANSCSAIFFIMEQLSLLNRFYQLSLDFFLEIFQYILHNNPNLKDIRDPAQRLQILERDLFQNSFRRTSRALLHDDQIIFAIMLGQVKLRGAAEQIDAREYDFLIGGAGEIASAQPSTKLVISYGEEVARRVAECSRLTEFSKLPLHMETNDKIWKAFLAEREPELNVPSWSEEHARRAPIITAFNNLIIVKCMRPDRLIPAAAGFVQAIFGPTFLNATDLNLRSVVMEEMVNPAPIALCSVAGHDASYRVENFAAEMSARMASVAMGSAEGFAQADAAIATAVKSGTWVLLKNVHLAPIWLGQLEKRLHSMKAHNQFRLFLTMETNPKVPVNLLRMSRILMFEPLPGIKANLYESLNAIPPTRVKAPSERARLHFLLGWLHAVVQERLRYSPLGWSKVYEFNDSDQDMALTVIDHWIDTAAQGRANVPPAKIPWKAIRTLIKETVYGGKIDNEFDQYLLNSFVDRLFTPASYDVNYPLVEEMDGISKLAIPDGIRMEQFLEWVDKLPEQQPPTWLGLPDNAEMMRMILKGEHMLSNVRKLRYSAEDDEMAYIAPTPGTAGNGADQSGHPTWMRGLSAMVTGWLELLPEALPSMRTDGDVTKSPLFRFFGREQEIAQDQLRVIREDLLDLQKMCTGKQKQTNRLRSLSNAISKGNIPQQWLTYKVPKRLALNQWMQDFNQRLKQLNVIAKAARYDNLQIWLGGFAIPEAFITATRQTVAHITKSSLEELELDVSIGFDEKISSNAEHTDGFALSGMRLEGAEWIDDGLVLSSALQPRPIQMFIRWVKRRGDKTGRDDVLLPVYLNEERQDILFTAQLRSKEPSDALKMIQRCVAILATTF